MALIHCPECDREISDKVNACPHCGYPLVEISTSDTQVQPQQVEVTSVKLSKGNNKKIAIIAISIIVIFLAVFFGIKYLNERKAQRAYEEAFNNYVDNLTQVQILMLSGGSDAEGLCNLTASVWQNAIYEESDSTTDKYTKPYGIFVDDFNDALVNLFNASSTLSTIVDIESNQTSVQELMKEFINPPEGLEECYKTVTELYTAYKGLTDLAANPTGSLNSYNESKKQKISDFMDAYDKLKYQIPEKFSGENTDD